MTSTRPEHPEHRSPGARRRCWAVAAVAVAALLPLGVATPAASAPQSGAVARAPGHHGNPDSAFDRVADFYGAYIDAHKGPVDAALSSALRHHYLAPDLRRRLALWERRHHADGVLRAQATPRAWQVTYAGSGAGHSWAIVRLTWGSWSHHQYSWLSVQTTLSTGLISDIRGALHR